MDRVIGATMVIVVIGLLADRGLCIVAGAR